MSTFSVSRAIVTGGARGIGEAISRRLASEGFAVAVLDVDEAGAKASADSIAAETGSTVVGLRCDVTDRGHVDEVFAQAAEALGGLDTLIANAGITRDRMFHKLTDEDWDAVIAVNLSGVFASLRAASPWLRADGPGRAVLISSVVAKSGNLGQMNYIAAKAGVVGLVRSASLELARFGTTVNGIRPGFIASAMTDAIPQAQREAMQAAIPIGRSGVPADIAGAVAFLASDDASYITGHVIDVNGGSQL